MLAFVPIEGEPISWFGVFRAFLGNDLYVRTKDHVDSFTHDEVERMLAARFIVDERPLPTTSSGSSWTRRCARP